jgi:DNA/RNA endonuclease YhcR with UshA esterase domain
VVITGKVVDSQHCLRRGFAARVYAIDDGTGRLSIVFSGTRAIPGTVEGTQCTVEGTALVDRRGIVLWSPFYRFEL